VVGVKVRRWPVLLGPDRFVYPFKDLPVNVFLCGQLVEQFPAGFVAAFLPCLQVEFLAIDLHSDRCL
jgi:hypothetical protein